MGNLTPAEVVRVKNANTKGTVKIDVTQVFIDKLVKGEPFTLSNDQQVKLVKDNNAISVLKTRDTKLIGKLLFKDAKAKNKTYKISQFKKTAEFGGKPPPGGEAERKAYNAVNAQIEGIMRKTGMKYVPVVIPGINDRKPYRITSALWTEEYLRSSPEKATLPKADLELVDDTGKSVIFISYKDNYGRRKKKNGTMTVGRADPKGFQQFGGMSERGSPEIYSFDIVQEFIKYCQLFYEGKQFPQGHNIACDITGEGSELLKKKSIYGLGYGPKASYGRDNCQLVLQGRIEFQTLGKYYTVKASHTMINSPNSTDGMEGGYSPILFVRANPGRGDSFGIKGVRFTVYPKGAANIKESVTRDDMRQTLAKVEKAKKKKK